MSDLSLIARHAGTVLTGQLAVMAFGITDTIVAGRHAEASLAALSVASAIFVSVYVALTGVLQALLPVWSEQRGAHRPEAIGQSLRQGLYLCALASVAGAARRAPAPYMMWPTSIVPPWARWSSPTSRPGVTSRRSCTPPSGPGRPN